ncbi:MAG: hypothetical protein ACM36C_13055 [Acidobacteriota bacterium]
MYSVLITAHSWLRWLVLLAGILAFVGAVMGRSSRRTWGPGDNSPGRWYTILFDIQFLVGLLLYVWASPITMAARENMGAAMGNSATRFWLVEHPFGMIVALALAHVGRSRVRKAMTDRERFTKAALFYGLSLLIALLSLPWPGLPYGRALLRMP